MGELAVDPRQEDAMLRAIGFVVLESSMLAESLHSFARALSGSALVADMLAEAPLGTQVRQVRNLLSGVRARGKIESGLAADIGRVLSILDGPLIARRNDVAHGLWICDLTPEDNPEGFPDCVMCERRKSFGLVRATTTVRSLYLIGDAMRLAENALTHTGSTHDLARPKYADLRDELLGRYYDAGGAVDELSAAVRAMDEGTAEGWLWRDQSEGRSASAHDLDD